MLFLRTTTFCPSLEHRARYFGVFLMCVKKITSRARKKYVLVVHNNYDCFFFKSSTIPHFTFLSVLRYQEDAISLPKKLCVCLVCYLNVYL